MDVEFADGDLERLESDPEFTAGHAKEVVRGFRKAIQAVRAALDERDLYRGGLRMEKLQGKRQGQCSLRINGQWRLIISIDGEWLSQKIKIIEIIDYH